jgi:peptidoglycan/xylan/chitin deacetylase (PgdA/CDA1 family)
MPTLPSRCLVRAFAVALSLTSLAAPALAADCPGNPDALGTSRTIVVDPAAHPRVGTMQYEETLPLRDHEVVLTFDDGPLPPHSTQVLNILASQCVKATFFIIGRMATQYPDGVRRVRDAGHTIGTHSQNHPLSFEHMPMERVMAEVQDGIASTKAALGNDKDLAPFFRIPGLRRSKPVDDYLASQGLMTWSADFPADDWKRIPPAKVIGLALSRLEAKGKGILLLHDIQGRTVAALPTILHELKVRGFHIVHVVPATPDRPKTPTEPGEWRMKPSATPSVAAFWPRVPRFSFVATAGTVVPDAANIGAVDSGGNVIAVAGPAARTAIRLPPSPAWPRRVSISIGALTSHLPIPALQLFGIGNTDPVAGLPDHHVEGGTFRDDAGTDRAMNELARANSVASCSPPSALCRKLLLR